MPPFLTLKNVGSFPAETGCSGPPKGARLVQ